MDAIAKKVLELALSWLMNPDNLKKVSGWVVEYIDKKAKENPEINYWDTLDEMVDTIIELWKNR